MGPQMIQNIWRDISYAARSLQQAPTFATAAVLTLAVGIGATTAVFSILDAALLKPLPVRDPGQLATVNPFRGTRPGALSYPVFRDLSAQQDVFSDIAASGSADFESVRVEGAPQELDHVDGAFVSANYFTMLGVPPALGRMFTTLDGESAGEPVAVISDAFWERQFALDPTVVGRTVFLNKTPFTIVGVAPRGFFGDRVGTVRDIWIPILAQPRLGRDLLDVRTASWFRTIGRLKEGLTEQQANVILTGLFRRLMADEIASGAGTRVNPGQPSDYRMEIALGSTGLNTGRLRFKRPLTLLMTGVGLLLLIACGNVANLLLARGASRGREVGIRLAIGSGRRRLLQQFLTESLLLALAGGALGLVVALWTRDAVAAQLSEWEFVIPLDLRLLAFALSLSTVTALIFGVVPALKATSPHIGRLLQPADITRDTRHTRQRLARTLIVGQIALSLSVLVGAGLLVRTLQNLRQVDIGVDRAGVMAITLRADEGTIAPSEFPAIRLELAERLKRVQGVGEIAFSAYGLFTGGARTAPVRVPGSPVNPSDDPDVRQNYVSADYFKTLGMTASKGRVFAAEEVARDADVTVINESMARHYFGDANPVGRMIYFPRLDERRRYIPFNDSLTSAHGYEVVGVVRDGKYDDLREPAQRMAFLPLADVSASRAGSNAGLMYVRVSSASNDFAAALQRAVIAVNPNLSVRQIGTLDAHIDATLIEEQTLTRLLSLFGAIALFLTCVGLYGVMAYTVGRRTSEIGLRVAVGARPRDVISMVLRDTLFLAAAGVAVGIIASVGSLRILTSVLYGLTPRDPGTIGAVAALIFIVLLLAAAIPARRAARIDPAIALRAE